MNKKKIKSAIIPAFKNEDEERAFWDTHSVFDFPDQFKRVKMVEKPFVSSVPHRKQSNGPWLDSRELEQFPLQINNFALFGNSKSKLCRALSWSLWVKNWS